MYLQAYVLEETINIWKKKNLIKLKIYCLIDWTRFTIMYLALLI